MIKYYGILLLSILLTTVVQASLKAISVKYNGSFFDGLFDFKFYFLPEVCRPIYNAHTVS